MKALNHSIHKNRGVALVTVLILLVMMVSLVAIVSLSALSNRRSSVNTRVTAQAQYLAEAGVETAINQVFYVTRKNFEILQNTTGGPSAKTQLDTCVFQLLLTGKIGIDNTVSAPKNNNNNGTCTYLWNTSLVTGSAPVVQPAVAKLYNGASATLQKSALDGQYDVTITRVDAADGGINFTFESTGKLLNGSSELAVRKVRRNVQITATPFPGDKFALLTDNAECSFCHLQVDTMRRVYAPLNDTKEFDRALLGSANAALAFRNAGHYSDSLIAGTVITRNTVGPPANEGNAATPGDGTYAAKWGNTPGKIKAGAASTILGDRFATTAASGTTDLGNAPNSSAAQSLNAFNYPKTSDAKMYFNYPDSTSVQADPYKGDFPDVELPNDFPSVIDDANGNRLIDDAEWTAFLAQSAGGGSLTGGVLYGVRRPSTSVANIPISFDPISSNPALFATTPAGSSRNLAADLAALALLNPPAAADLATFTSNWRGWLLQQALASPNNRDYLPTNPTFVGTTPTIGAAIPFIPIFWPATGAAGLTNGASPNNFWVNYDPRSGGTITLDYCRVATCSFTVGTGSLTATRGTLNGSSRFTLTNVNPTWFPAQSNAASTQLSGGGRFDGNLIIDGGRIQDSQVPLSITGTVAVNGDVVIRGRIKGTGRIIARGNIYVIGDLVYDCGNRSCKTDEYADPADLPRLALLAGGNMIIGDYDAPDFRTNFQQFNLTNDQTYQWRNPSANNADRSTGSANATRTPYVFYNIPGATGLNRNGTFNRSWDTTGFIGRLITSPNSRNSRRYFSSAPFGFINNCNDADNYEDINNNCFLNTTAANGVNLSIIPLYPSNGPMKIGGATNAGMYAVVNNANQLAPNVGCETRPFVNGTDPALPPVGIGSGAANWGALPPTTNAGAAYRSSFTFSFWCPPAASGSVLRNGRNFNAAATAGLSPANTANAWFAQPPQNAALDGGIGMTTGWLAGLVGSNVNTANSTGVFTQLGDLSQTRLLKMMWLATMEDGLRDADNQDDKSDKKGPLRTDGIFYSPHSIFALARYYQNANGGSESSTQSRWIHNGSVISSSLGFLLTGNVLESKKQFTTNKTDKMDFTPALSGSFKGPGMGIFYDDRLVGLLGITGASSVRLNRVGTFTQTGR
jgi:type II secretory pathway pseudopilin PulG